MLQRIWWPLALAQGSSLWGGKIECETKREKKDFCLGGTQEEGECKVLSPSGR